MKVGIYGGSFDPIHIAHLIIAEYARCEFSLDRIVFVPGYIPPHKRNRTLSEPRHRLEMVRLAVADHPAFAVSDFEIARRKVSYTIDTLLHFAQQYSLTREQLFLIIGQDNLETFDQWKDPGRILETATLLAVDRPNTGKKLPRVLDKAIIFRLNSPLMDISSSVVRERVKSGASIRYLTPSAVEAYIVEHRLYREEPPS